MADRVAGDATERARERLETWADDEGHAVRSARHYEPYSNPAELRADVRAVVAGLVEETRAREQAEAELVLTHPNYWAMRRERDEATALVASLRDALGRATYLARNLHGMIAPQTWRDHGGDDGQGHYEGDYRAEQVHDQIVALEALARTEGRAGE